MSNPNLTHRKNGSLVPNPLKCLVGFTHSYLTYSKRRNFKKKKFLIFFYLKVIWKVGCSFLVKKKLQSIFWTLLNSKRIYDLWEKTKIESNQLYITNGQEEEVRENIKKCNREREKKRERKRLELDWKFHLLH